jgi:hypothetical protein
MEIKSSGDNLHIFGNIKSISHYHAISKELDNLLINTTNIKIHIMDSISITSSVIGYLCKLVTTTKSSLSLFVKDEGLHELLEDLNLIKLLNVKKI